ncbi:MAG: hypothetical protein IJ174_07120 [Clostridia bacterium]|nr:hypothetical protein [Clostridia bacterium]
MDTDKKLNRQAMEQVNGGAIFETPLCFPEPPAIPDHPIQPDMPTELPVKPVLFTNPDAPVLHDLADGN